MKTLLNVMIIAAAFCAFGATSATAMEWSNGFHKHESRNYWHKHADNRVVTPAMEEATDEKLKNHMEQAGYHRHDEAGDWHMHVNGEEVTPKMRHTKSELREMGFHIHKSRPYMHKHVGHDIILPELAKIEIVKPVKFAVPEPVVVEEVPAPVIKKHYFGCARDINLNNSRNCHNGEDILNLRGAEMEAQDAAAAASSWTPSSAMPHDAGHHMNYDQFRD